MHLSRLILLPVVAVTLLSLSSLEPVQAEPQEGWGNMHRQDKHFLEENNIEGLNPEDISEKDEAFYFFRLHDRNGDGYLDGNELLASFKEDHADGEESLPLEDLVDWVDHVLRDDDIDGDGRIDWDEFVSSQD
ncbi:MAG: hypothetical protein DHS80DRAFT_23743 [Piptocephalis tieghemiana]|nr:MAG: hypothetical protein DHS80DRAFT_23743 [Piptocephalis tieghemiana]